MRGRREGERMVSVGLLGLLLAAATSVGSTQVEVTGGAVRGTELPDGSTLFYGIPYAAAPTGERRWRAPEAVVPWRGVRDATRPPSPCIQHDEGWNSKD